MRTLDLHWSHGTARVLTTAGMLSDVVFELDGRRVEPFARAPWAPDEVSPDEVGHLRVLGAEFACVPFGSAPAAPDLDERWSRSYSPVTPDPPHGLSADANWTVVHSDPSSITLELFYPPSSPIRRLERRIRARDGEPAIDLQLVVEARRAARVPVGLHPILRLPERPRSLTLSVDFVRGYTYPATVAPGAMVTTPAATFTDLHRVPGEGGGDVDLAALPLGGPVEDVVQLAGVRGPVRAEYQDDGFALEIEWDTTQLPSVMIWYSDRALQDAPWQGRYRGLGIEMIAGAFDMPIAEGGPPTPIAQDGYATGLDLEPNEPVTLSSSLRAVSL